MYMVSVSKAHERAGIITQNALFSFLSVATGNMLYEDNYSNNDKEILNHLWRVAVIIWRESFTKSAFG